MQFIVEQGQTDQKETDVLVIGVFAEQKNPKGCFSTIDSLLDGGLTSYLQQEEGSSKFKKINSIHTLGKVQAKRVFLVGLGEEEKVDFDKAREVFSRVTQELMNVKAKQVTYCLDSFLGEHLAPYDVAHGLAEASLLATYRFEHYKTGERERVSLEKVYVSATNLDVEIKQGLAKGKAFGEGTRLARDLVNTPGNLLTPTNLAEKAIEIAKRYQMDYHILDRKEMEELGMGALLAVAQGSDQPPKMIVLKYQGLEDWKDVLAFVGKGLTFDSGGISIKPSANMDEMKMDMGGSASVLGAMETIGCLQPACNILAVIPSSENMPNGRALKPGDVITSLSGKTIEVKNTDAEGRLILADGITYAKQLGANYIVDLATLTGAVLIALGNCTTGAVTNNEDLMLDVLEAAQETGELMWRLPNFDPYKEMVKSSDVADLNNAPGRLAGSITAGLFLGEFAEETPWVHLDIAGTAWTDKKSDSSQKGATGVMVRTLATLAENVANKNGE